MYVRSVTELSTQGAKVVLQGAIEKAEQMGVPQCVAIVDKGGNLLIFGRMQGAKILSQFSAIQKAVTAVSSRSATGQLPSELAFGIATPKETRSVTK